MPSLRTLVCATLALGVTTFASGANIAQTSWYGDDADTNCASKYSSTYTLGETNKCVSTGSLMRWQQSFCDAESIISITYSTPSCSSDSIVSAQRVLSNKCLGGSMYMCNATDATKYSGSYPIDGFNLIETFYNTTNGNTAKCPFEGRSDTASRGTSSQKMGCINSYSYYRNVSYWSTCASDGNFIGTYSYDGLDCQGKLSEVEFHSAKCYGGRTYSCGGSPGTLPATPSLAQMECGDNDDPSIYLFAPNECQDYTKYACNAEGTSITRTEYKDTNCTVVDSTRTYAADGTTCQKESDSQYAHSYIWTCNAVEKFGITDNAALGAAVASWTVLAAAAFFALFGERV